MFIVSSAQLGDGAVYIPPPSDVELALLKPAERLIRLREYNDAQWARTIAVQTLNDIEDRPDLLDAMIFESRALQLEQTETHEHHYRKNRRIAEFDQVASATLSRAVALASLAVKSFTAAANESVKHIEQFAGNIQPVVDEFVARGSQITQRIAKNVDGFIKTTQPSSSPVGQTPSGFQLAMAVP